jgi:hypothetical protein
VSSMAVFVAVVQGLLPPAAPLHRPLAIRKAEKPSATQMTLSSAKRCTSTTSIPFADLRYAYQSLLCVWIRKAEKPSATQMTLSSVRSTDALRLRRSVSPLSPLTHCVCNQGCQFSCQLLMLSCICCGIVGQVRKPAQAQSQHENVTHTIMARHLV